MERKLEEIDEILASYEDWMHGINGEQCTKARKLLHEVQQQLKILNIPVVSNRMELLIDFYEWLDKQNYKSEIYDKPAIIDKYLGN